MLADLTACSDPAPFWRGEGRKGWYGGRRGASGARGGAVGMPADP